MEVKTTLDQWDPFNFRIEGASGFKFHIEGLIREERIEDALERINLIRKKYNYAKEFDLIKQDNFRHTHFKRYKSEEEELKAQGKTYPGGLKDKVIFELSKLEQRIKDSSKKKSITVKELALYLWYSRPFVLDNEFDTIAKDHGFDNGKKLKQEFNYFSIDANRTADPESRAKLLHKIKLFEKVKNLLDESKRAIIEDELKTLRTNLSRY